MEQSAFTEFDFEGFKNSRPVRCNSELLFNFLLLLEWDTQVDSYFQSQVEITITHNKCKHRTNTDLWVKYKNQTEKLIHLLDAEATQLYSNQPALFTKVKRACSAPGWRYTAVRENQVSRQPINYNLRRLWHYAQLEIRLGHRLLVGDFFLTERTPTFGKLKALLMKFDFPSEYVYTFIFHKLVLADVSFFAISEDTPLISGDYAVQTEHIKFAAA